MCSYGQIILRDHLVFCIGMVHDNLVLNMGKGINSFFKSSYLSVTKTGFIFFLLPTCFRSEYNFLFSFPGDIEFQRDPIFKVSEEYVEFVKQKCLMLMISCKILFLGCLQNILTTSHSFYDMGKVLLKETF